MVDNTQNRKVITGDGSVSVYMGEYGETMHTTSGHTRRHTESIFYHLGFYL